MPKYANVIVDISHESVDRAFSYEIPAHLLDTVSPGISVTIPFGKGNTLRQGYVLELTDHVTFDPTKIKSIAGVIKGDVPVEQKLLQLAWWMKNRYGSTMIAALKTVIPARVKTKPIVDKTIVSLMSAKELSMREAECTRKHQHAKARLLQALMESDRLPYRPIMLERNLTDKTVQSLAAEGVLKVEENTVYRTPIRLEGERGKRKILSHAQQEIVDLVLRDYDDNVRKTYLLHGITGSGKTEVYIELIRGIMERGKQAIVLIPEIALTYQTVLRFYRQFGNRVSVLNSSLSAGEKFDQCERAKAGDLDVIIGPRSALFTPFPNLGLIIVDEEHESTYKSDVMPKYHAVETAKELAKLHGASVFLGSATPSLDSFYRAKKGEYTLFTLNERLTGNSLPKVYIEDLRKELREGNRSIFSRRLQELMDNRLEKGEQIMLFLNRRGYAGFVSCRSCGLVLKCPHCEVSLSEHGNGKMICHYCGYEIPKPKLCPECGSPYIMGFKAGTEQIEQKLKEMYSEARILRMDADTTRKKGDYERILSAFSAGEADILLGTQMIVKGHDFPRVTLMGILAADMSLFSSDYMAAERTFQLLTQAAGRAGRGDCPGEVVIQTYQPEHYSIIYAAGQDYEGFYEEELLYRELGGYPPASHLLAVLVISEKPEEGENLLKKIRMLMEKQEFYDKIRMIGPAPAVLSKLQDRYRTMIYIKSNDYGNLICAKDCMEDYLQTLQNLREKIQFDFNPIHMY